MISRKTLLRNVAGFFVSAKDLKERGFKFFKLLVPYDGDNIIYLLLDKDVANIWSKLQLVVWTASKVANLLVETQRYGALRLTTISNRWPHVGRCKLVFPRSSIRRDEAV